MLKKLKAYEQYKAGKLDHITYITKRDEISSKLEAVRLDLAEIERKAKEGEYNLTASIEIEKKLREVIALEAFDKKIILYVIEKIIVKDCFPVLPGLGNAGILNMKNPPERKHFPLRRLFL